MRKTRLNIIGVLYEDWHGVCPFCNCDSFFRYRQRDTSTITSFDCGLCLSIAETENFSGKKTMVTKIAGRCQRTMEPPLFRRYVERLLLDESCLTG